MNIGIVLLATNVYFVLAIRFIKNFMFFYKGNSKITFYVFSDTDPSEYIQGDFDIVYFHRSNNNWLDGTNQKFECILSIKEKIKSDYLFYFDADTDIRKDFNESWFIGDLVGNQHFGDQCWMAEEKHYDRNPESQAYIPLNTTNKQMYFHGALFGGTTEKCFSMSKELKLAQEIDKKINYEPRWNDESYINKYFHYNPPTRIVMANEYEFCVSDKGGLEDIRNSSLDISEHKNNLIKYRDSLIRIENGQVLPVLAT
jgi:hypothetical protein